MEETNQQLIICAEDDPEDFQLFWETASTLHPSLHIVHAENGEVLLKKLEKFVNEGKKPCLIIMDVNMPIMDGREALMQIQKHEQWREIPVAIYTTSSKELYKDLEQQYGAKVFMKPVTYTDIIETVKSLLSYCK